MIKVNKELIKNLRTLQDSDLLVKFLKKRYATRKQ
jgi:hypothetical protein